MNPFDHHKRGAMTGARVARRSDYYERRAWFNMNSRCNNPCTPWFHRYGGRGIQVRYKSYDEFLSDVGPRPSQKHSLDRIDNDGHYEPGNCRWSTRREQLLNTSRNNRLSHAGQTLTIDEWAKVLGIKRNTLVYRLRRGWDIERCLSCSSAQKVGSSVTTSKLTEADVAAILVDDRSDSELALIYGVSRKAIYLVRKRKSWKHVKSF